MDSHTRSGTDGILLLLQPLRTNMASTVSAHFRHMCTMVMDSGNGKPVPCQYLHARARTPPRTRSAHNRESARNTPKHLRMNLLNKVKPMLIAYQVNDSAATVSPALNTMCRDGGVLHDSRQRHVAAIDAADKKATVTASKSVSMTAKSRWPAPSSPTSVSLSRRNMAPRRWHQRGPHTRSSQSAIHFKCDTRCFHEAVQWLCD